MKLPRVNSDKIIHFDLDELGVLSYHFFLINDISCGVRCSITELGRKMDIKP